MGKKRYNWTGQMGSTDNHPIRIVQMQQISPVKILRIVSFLLFFSCKSRPSRSRDILKWNGDFAIWMINNKDHYITYLKTKKILAKAEKILN